MSDRGVNRVELLGRVGGEPQLRTIPNGQAVLNFRMVTRVPYLSGNERRSHEDWHRITVWGKQAEALARMLERGTLVRVEGRIQTRSYEKDGRKQYVTEIVAGDCLVLSGRGEGRRDPASESPDAAKGEDDVAF